MRTPPKGMYYESVRKKVKRIQHNAPESDYKKGLQSSLLNQAERHQAGAGAELNRELTFRGQSFSGTGNRQVGYGPGKKFGEGKWHYANGKWEKV